MAQTEFIQHGENFWVLNKSRTRIERWSFNDSEKPFGHLDIPRVYAFTVSPDLQTAVLSTHEKLVLVNLADGSEISSIPQKKYGVAMGLRFFNDGTRLMAGLQWGLFLLLNAKTLEVIAESDNGDYPIYSAVHPNGNYSCWSAHFDMDTSLMLYRISSDKLEWMEDKEIEHCYGASEPAFSPDGRLLACGDAYAFKIFVFPEMKLQAAFLSAGQNVSIDQEPQLKRLESLWSNPVFHGKCVTIANENQLLTFDLETQALKNQIKFNEKLSTYLPYDHKNQTIWVRQGDSFSKISEKEL